MTTEDDLRVGYAYSFRRHYFIGLLKLQDTILMDARFMSEGVLADDGFVRLHYYAREPGHHFTGIVYLLGNNIGATIPEIFPYLERHNDFFQRSIAGPLADAVNGALHLPRSVLDSAEGVSHRQSQIIVTVNADYCLIDVTDPPHQFGNLGAEFVRHCVTCRVRNIYRCGASIDDSFCYFRKISDICSAGILGREFHIVSECFRIGHSVARHL